MTAHALFEPIWGVYDKKYLVVLIGCVECLNLVGCLLYGCKCHCLSDLVYKCGLYYKAGRCRPFASIASKHDIALNFGLYMTLCCVSQERIDTDGSGALEREEFEARFP